MLGGGAPGGALARGLFVEPTIFDRRGQPGMRIAQEEIFGPVVSVIPFEGEAEAIEHRQRHALRPGRRGVDARHLPRLPRGPEAARRHRLGESHAARPTSRRRGAAYKMSGGGRELGLHGVDNYLEMKQVHVNLNENPMGWY